MKRHLGFEKVVEIRTRMTIVKEESVLKEKVLSRRGKRNRTLKKNELKKR